MLWGDGLEGAVRRFIMTVSATWKDVFRSPARKLCVLKRLRAVGRVDVLHPLGIMPVMLDQADLTTIEAELDAKSSAHRAFFIPIVRAIASLGGRARKRDVEKKIRALLTGSLTEKQLDYLELKNRYGWARNDLKNAGVVTGERGYWELTELGRAYADRHAQDAISVDLDIPESEAPARSGVKTESVPVTAFRAYEIPVLHALASGATDKSEILDRVRQFFGDQLRPGDFRAMPAGMPVWEFRASWAISNLGKDGLAENTGTGEWVITSAGRERLQQEQASWNSAGFRNAYAKVRIDGVQNAEAPVKWNDASWKALRAELPKTLFDQLHARLRPDLGPSPDTSIARNVVLYGPPGTGKTFLAKAIARALTGEQEVREDGRFRLIQFHPSYAYEDFVQGMRPDLKQTQLRYQLQKGPFLRIAEAADQDPDALFVLVIDEINRGDPARIFGELLYALEYRDEAVALPLGGELIVPSNLVIIGTMNSVDRSVAIVDYALRRRFGFVRIDPEPDTIERHRTEGLLGEIGPTVLERFNDWLRQRLGREHCLGHSYFLSPSLPDDAPDVFERIWQTDVHPLMEEYFFGDAEAQAEAASQWHAIVRAALAARAEVEADSQAGQGMKATAT